MADEDTGSPLPSLPEAFRRILERLDRFPPLSPGIPPIRSLGPGTPSEVAEVEAAGQREPALDLIESSHSVFVTIELPGVSRREIDLRATETSLIVSANSPSRKYFREIPLPAPVRVDSIAATCRNGVLDVSLEKKDRAWRIRVS